MKIFWSWQSDHDDKTLKKEGVEVFVKRSLASGFAGIDNPQFCRDNTTRMPGVAKKLTEKIVKAMCGNAGVPLTLHNHGSVMAANSRMASAVQVLCFLARAGKDGSNSERIAESFRIDPVVADAFSNISNRMEWSRFVKGKDGGV